VILHRMRVGYHTGSGSGSSHHRQTKPRLLPLRQSSETLSPSKDCFDACWPYLSDQLAFLFHSQAGILAALHSSVRNLIGDYVLRS